MSHNLALVAGISAFAVSACSPPANEQQPAGQADSETAAVTFESQVDDYIRLFPYQDSFDYAVRYTQGDPTNLNVWVLGSEPMLVKAGEDTVVRMNNDTFYKMAFAHHGEGPVYLSAETPDRSRFVSFQLMDDRNVNYRNIIFPNGEYTLYHGELPEEIRGEAVEVPSEWSVVIVRVEVMDKNDETDVAEAEIIFRTITIEGSTPSAFPEVDVLGKFSEAVTEEGNRRLDRAFSEVPFRLTVVGPGQEPGVDVPYLNHSAGTKGGWGGPDTSHSAYETIFFAADGGPLVGSNGTYSVTTEEPPVDAFWSVTVYDTDRGGILHPNDDDRYHINNTTAVRNDDGTVTFVFKQNCDGDDTNCLEVPAGHFDLATRYYLPQEEIRSGNWTFPEILRHGD